VTTYGREFGMGPKATDAVSGWKFPRRLMIRLRGRLVSRDYKDGSRDRPEWY